MGHNIIVKQKKGFERALVKSKVLSSWPVWSALWYWLLGCAFEVGLTEAQSQVLSDSFLSFNLLINHLLNMLNFSFTVGLVPSIHFSFPLLSLSMSSHLMVGKLLLCAMHCIRSFKNVFSCNTLNSFVRYHVPFLIEWEWGNWGSEGLSGVLKILQPVFGGLELTSRFHEPQRLCPYFYISCLLTDIC